MNIRLYLMILVSLTCFHFKAKGTAQFADILIYKGDTLAIFSNPLEHFHQIDSVRKNLFGVQMNSSSTACNREYVAEWMIADHQLYLTAIYSCDYGRDSLKADLKRLFGSKCINGKVKADWVTMNIYAPQGKQLCYVHAPYESIYENEILFAIDKGQLRETKVLDNRKTRKSIYSDDKTLTHFIYSNIAWDKLPIQNDSGESEIRVFVKFSANELGIIDQVEVVKGYNEIYNHEAIRVIKSIPEWDVFFLHGEHKREPYVIGVRFSSELKKKYQQTEKE